jgi:uncharacterized protein (DUF1810 family)
MDGGGDLQRFVDAQEGVIEEVRAELAAGRKRSHWMWFIFPQIRGLGASPMAQRFAIANLEEARAYAAHPVLGARLRECVRLVVDAPPGPIEAILRHPDDLKFRSSMTLFARACADEPVFRAALERFFGGREDPATLERL